MASMDARIILGGQPVDALGAMDRGRQAAESQLALNQQNALNALMQSQGPGIMAGDPNALNALARFDPQAALGIKSTVRANSWAEEDRAAAKAEGRRAAEAALAANAAAVTKEKLAAEREAITRGLSGAAYYYQNGDRAGYEAFLRQAGLDPAEFPFEAFPAHAAMFEGALEAMEMFAPPAGPEWRSAKPEEAALYGATAGQINDKTGEFKKTGEGNGISYTTTNADGTTTTVQVGGKAAAGGSKPFTEGQSKDNVYVTRALGALERLESKIDPSDPNSPTFASTLTSRAGKVGEALGEITLGYSRELMQSDEFQTAMTAGQEYLQAILRKDTGAAITADEQALYGGTYLPQPGDSPARLEYKAEARKRAVAAMQAGMSLEQLEAVTRALRVGDTATADGILQAAAGGAPAPTATPAASTPPESFLNDPAIIAAAAGVGVSPAEYWSFFTPESQARFLSGGTPAPASPAPAGPARLRYNPETGALE